MWTCTIWPVSRWKMTYAGMCGIPPDSNDEYKTLCAMASAGGPELECHVGRAVNNFDEVETAVIGVVTNTTQHLIAAVVVADSRDVHVGVVRSVGLRQPAGYKIRALPVERNRERHRESA